MLSLLYRRQQQVGCYFDKRALSHGSVVGGDATWTQTYVGSWTEIIAQAGCEFHCWRRAQVWYIFCPNSPFGETFFWCTTCTEICCLHIAQYTFFSSRSVLVVFHSSYHSSAFRTKSSMCPPCLCILSSLPGYPDAYTCVSSSPAPPFLCCSIVSSCLFAFRLWFLTIQFSNSFFLAFHPELPCSHQAFKWGRFLKTAIQVPNCKATNQRSHPQRLQHLMFPLKERMTSLWPRCGKWFHPIIRG